MNIKSLLNKLVVNCCLLDCLMEDVQHQIYPQNSFTKQDFYFRNILFTTKIAVRFCRIMNLC
jgi:hypothetical protein